MAKATIPLASSKYNPAKLQFPCLVSVKLDGVPIKMTVTVSPDGTPQENYTLHTRSGEVNVSCQSIVRDWWSKNRNTFDGFVGKHYVVGEVTQLADRYAPFKDTSGIVRRQEDQGFTLQWNIFDYFWEGGDVSYFDRIQYFASHMDPTQWVKVVRLGKVNSIDELDISFEKFVNDSPKAEGLIARNYDDVYIEGKRSHGYQKLVKEPMIDLKIVGFEEAVEAKTGEGKGMVGRLIAEYKGEKIGIGPGKLTHDERVALFKSEALREETGGKVWYQMWAWDGPAPRMAQIKHKSDDSYDALRQPTFQCWRPDKMEPDA